MQIMLDVADYDMTHVFHIYKASIYTQQWGSPHCHAQTYRNDDLIL